MVLLQRRAAALFLFAFIFLMPVSHAYRLADSEPLVFL